MPERIDILRHVPEIEVQNYEDSYLRHLRRYYFAAHFFEQHLAADTLILDIPCGYGYGASILARTHPKKEFDVLGIDIDRETLDTATAKFASPSIWFEYADMLALDALVEPNSFEGITCFEGLEHTLHPDIALSQMHRALAPKGILLASIPIEACTNEWHRVCFPTEQPVRSLFESVFGHKYTIGSQSADGDAKVLASLNHDMLPVRDTWIIVAQKEEGNCPCRSTK